MRVVRYIINTQNTQCFGNTWFIHLQRNYHSHVFLCLEGICVMLQKCINESPHLHLLFFRYTLLVTSINFKHFMFSVCTFIFGDILTPKGITMTLSIVIIIWIIHYATTSLFILCTLWPTSWKEIDDAYFLVLFTCTIDLRLAWKMHYLC